MPEPVPVFTDSQIQQLAAEFPTPFHVYHADRIRQRVSDLLAAFSWNEGFKQFFAVKATPNPHIVKLLHEAGCGADCSSPAELVICERLGITGEEVMFTSNNTTPEEFQQAADLGAVINLDDASLIDQLHSEVGMPELISFRYNPGAEREGNVIIGNPKEAKFGLTREQMPGCYQKCKELGATRFGLHTMVVSNELEHESFMETARMLFELAVEIKEKTGIAIESINLGGGIGIPYRPEQQPLDLQRLGSGVQELYEQILTPAGLTPLKICMENGRSMTGPYGALITRVINKKHTHKRYVGVDACMSNLMRPGMYGAYHHITAVGKEAAPLAGEVDVVGSLCENNDKFAIDRELPEVEPGDLLVIHDAGAHGHSMGFQYNGRLRSAEIMLESDGSARQIRRAETLDDYFSTVEFPESSSSAASTESLVKQ
ncbi:diaminopimelate decarboxylase [Adhaeretor mobilis]|uniref:Diaminopimelate decarboxylase n=1 Tax=Adhaeretor mobilis TaxID=1930276 RepID=A0A517MZI1_9BACT|nr:diaminopimelate decarboxylase [Adhaeretor mobilis]QDT00290.1 Diaminopimelate decarboxylase [Adhaeretor mobilis]